MCSASVGAHQARCAETRAHVEDSACRYSAGGQLVKHRGSGRWKACAAEGWSSAKVLQLVVVPAQIPSAV